MATSGTNKDEHSCITSTGAHTKNKKKIVIIIFGHYKCSNKELLCSHFYSIFECSQNNSMQM